ncbi:MAG: SPFH domain-containing protein [Methylococcales bacterium]
MLIPKKITLSDTQRGLLFKNQQFLKILETGQYRYWSLNDDFKVDKYDITNPQGIALDEKLRHLINLYPQQFAAHLQVIETGEQEIALVYQHQVLQNILPESSAVAFWKSMTDLEIRKIDISQHQPLPELIDKALSMTKTVDLQSASNQTLAFSLADSERALLFEDDRLLTVLNEGRYRYWNQAGRLKLLRINIVDPLSLTNEQGLQQPVDKRLGALIADSMSTSKNDWMLSLIDQYEAVFSDFIIAWDTASDEVGLVYENGVLRDIHAPGKRGFYWKTARLIEVRKQPVAENHQALDEALARQLRNPRETRLQNAIREAVYTTEVTDKHVGFLIVDGKLQHTLAPGAFAWWTFNRKVLVKHLDMRLQNMEVNGQEILTKDRVSLRINLSATWQVSDAEKVVMELNDWVDYLYRELQLALRSVVSTRSLDELLEHKHLLNQEVLDIVAKKATEFGIELKSTGVKDIILPSEMKEILAQVVEAQKVAEANLIRRREETQATRSLHNTAKVMEGNPVLLRLKELEVLEKITGRINTLNVYGGLDGVMNDMVRITDKH